MKRFLRWAGLGLGLWLTSCASGPGPEEFEVTLVNVASQQAGGGGVGEAALTFTIRLQNAMPEPIVLTGGAHKIYLNNVYLGQALSNERVEVARLSTATEDVTVRLSTFRLARALYGVYRSQRVDYRVASTLYAETEGKSRRFRAERVGTVDLSGLNLPPPGN